MSQVDVVARLQLRAEQFSAETQARFGEMAQRAAGAAQTVRTQFVSSFAEVKKLAKEALVLPRTASGSLDLSSEIASLRQAALASEEHATALRELQAAALRASNSERVVTEAMRDEAAAAEIAAVAAEKDASVTRQRILALEELQRELNKTSSATGLNTERINANGTANARGIVSAGQQRAAMQQLGFQLNDIATQWASGTKGSVIFAQQSGQVIQALQMMGGEGNKFLKFLGGPWGITLSAAAVVLAPLIAKAIEGGDEISRLTDKMAEQAAKADQEARANDRWAASVDGVATSTRKAREELDRLLTSQNQQINNRASDEQRAMDRLVNGGVDPRDGNGGINITKQQLAAARRALQQAQTARGALGASTGSEGSNALRATADSRIETAEAEVNRLQDRLLKLQEAYQERSDNLRAAHFLQIERDVQASATARGREEQRFTDEWDDLRARRRTMSEADYKAEYKRIFDLHQAKMKALEDEASNSRERGRTVTAEEAKAIAERAGLQVNSARRTIAEQKALWNKWVAGGRDPRNPVAFPNANAPHVRGDALDIQATAGVTIQRIRAAFAAEGVRVTRWQMEQGHFHVQFNGDRTAAQAVSAETREAAEEQRQLKRDLEALVGAFDPAREAADAYAQAMDRIARLSASGGLSFREQLDFGAAARAKFDAARGALPALGDVGALLPGLGSIPFRKDADPYGDARREMDAELRDRQAETIRFLSGLYGDLFNGQTRNIAENLRRLGSDALGDFLSTQTASMLKKLPKGLQSLLSGNNVREGLGGGQLGGSIFAALGGGSNNALASSAGGVLGEVAGKSLGPAISKAIGGTLGKTLGGAAGPIGSILGGVLGSALGGLFKKSQAAGAGITTSGGVFGAGSASGTSGLTGQASGLAGSVSAGLQRIADALGASITGSTDVQIGMSNGNVHINTHGGQIGKKGSGDTNFGSDQEGAIRAAIADALSDGVLSGISDAAQRILRSGQDIDRALTKALAIESIPKELKSMLDPVGAALDALNTKWKATVAALDEGGASAEQRAQAEQLYKLQLDQVKASTVSASQGLKDFVTSLKVGGNSPYSLRDQEATAKAALQPFLDTIGAGGRIDQAKYQEAAKTYLDIERQLYGSTQAYFDQMDAIQAATNKAIEAIDNAVPIGTPVESPFVKATADATAATANGVTTTNELLSQLSDQFSGLQQIMAAIASGSVGGGFIGELRGFAQAA